jgi:hypothetical protein
MTTIILKSDLTIAPTSLGTLSLPAIDLAVARISSLVAWWRADQAYASDGTWRDRKIGRRLTRLSTGQMVQTASVIGGQTALLDAANSNTIGDPDGQNLVQTSGDFTIALCMQSKAATAWNPWSNGTATAATCTYLQRRADEKFSLTQGGTALGSSATVHTGGAPSFVVDSWEQAATQRILRVNGTQELSFTTAIANANSQLLIGSASLALAGGGASPQYVADVFVFNKPLAKSTYSTDLATLESYFTGRYGAVFA